MKTGIYLLNLEHEQTDTETEVQQTECMYNFQLCLKLLNKFNMKSHSKNTRKTQNSLKFMHHCFL